jgi:hypothetical protein
MLTDNSCGVRRSFKLVVEVLERRDLPSSAGTVSNLQNASDAAGAAAAATAPFSGPFAELVDAANAEIHDIQLDIHIFVTNYRSGSTDLQRRLQQAKALSPLIKDLYDYSTAALAVTEVATNPELAVVIEAVRSLPDLVGAVSRLPDDLARAFAAFPNSHGRPTSPHTHPHPSINRNTLNQMLLPPIPEGPVVSSPPNQQIFFDENAPGGPPGR